MRPFLVGALALAISCTALHAAGPAAAPGDPLPPRALARLGTARLMHADSVSNTAFSADGKRFASVSVPAGDAAVWEWPSGKLVRRFAVPATDATLQVRLSPDGNFLAVSGVKYLRLWDVRTGKEMDVPDRHAWVCFSPSGNLFAWIDTRGQVSAIDLRSGKVTGLWQVEGTPQAVGCDAKDRVLVAATVDKSLEVRDATGNERLYAVEVGEGFRWADFTPDGETLVHFAVPAGFEVVQPRNARVTLREARHPVRFVPCAMDPTGRLILMRTPRDGTVRVVDLGAGGKTVRHWPSATQNELRLGSFSPDGKLLALGRTGGPHAATFYDAKTGEAVEVVPGHREPLQTLAFSPDGSEVATGAFVRHDPVVRFWDPATGRVTRRLSSSFAGIVQVAYTPDGKGFLAAGDGPKESEATLFDAGTLQKVRSFTGHRARVTGFTLSGAGAQLLTLDSTYSNAEGILWDLASGKKLAQDGDLGNGVRSAALLPGNRVALLGALGMQRWTPGAKLRDEDRVLEGQFARIALSPDGRAIVAASAAQREVCLTEFLTGKAVAKFPVEDKVSALAFSPGGRYVALLREDGVIVVWDRVTQKTALTWQAHGKGGALVAFSPDGKRLASSGGGPEAAEALVWDVSDLPRALPAAERPDAKQLDALFADLAGPDAALAERAVWALAAHPEAAIAQLKTRAAAQGVKPGQVAALIKLLDSDDFEEREKATAKLIALGPAAREPAQAALAASPSAEQKRRLEDVLTQTKSESANPAVRFAGRAVWVLDEVATPEARALLKQWAGESSPLGQEAARALERLGTPGKK